MGQGLPHVGRTAPGDRFTIATLRRFVKETFNDEELRDFCLDYFTDLYHDFTAGMSQSQMVRLMISYCQRRERMPDLLAALHRERPAQFDRRFKDPTVPHLQQRRPRTLPRRNSRQLFISYAHQDAPFASRLAADLQARGRPVWIAPDSIEPGEKWVEAINRGLEECGVFVLVLTPEAAASRWVRNETNVAIELESEGQLRFIPLDVAECRLPPLWRAYQRISFRQDYDVGLDLLLAKLAEKEVGCEAALPVKMAEPRPSDVFRTVYGPGLQSLLMEREEQEAVDENGTPEIQVELPAEPRVQPATSGDRYISSKDGKEMVRVPAGEFLYHDQRVSRSLAEFWIDKAPVTNGEYGRFVAETGWQPPKHWQGASPSTEIAEHPVVYVSWHDALAYAHWAGKRLPTEEEWEKAARGNDGRKFPWGDQWAEGLCNSEEAGVGTTTPVGNYSPQGDSPFGCVDMSGNVWEWTISDASNETKVMRGGSWISYWRGTRAANRVYDIPTRKFNNLGFRCAADPAA